MLLRRLAYPSRLEDLEPEFGGRKACVLSSVINTTAQLIYGKIKDKMEFDQRMVDRYHDRSATAIFDKVGRLSNCFGFIDGTIRRICRPTYYQKQAYSGHKRTHCIKFQSVIMANGLIVGLCGPFEGRRHDSYMLRQSDLKTNMELYPGYVIYGDSGYPLKSWLITPFSRAAPTEAELRFNRDLSKARIAVEWVFGWIARYWKFFDLKSNMMLYKSPVGLLYVVAAFLTNCLSCVRRRNQASKYFRCKLPTLAIYLAGIDTNEEINEADYSSDENEDFFDDESDLSSGDESGDGSESDAESELDSEEEREMMLGGSDSSDAEDTGDVEVL
ncbi:hypothetical protein PHMEG_00010185 [Phytophthora megakarya]|uniref:DDE Tnp4 domain-containing protein n=1 Tax=Phytophthora megakarya TaxID=4795 RepID=A0A225WEB5_9STRA|nr:hypothetical protein PHMEG_00010185 [Phytophthora megakarya]